MTRLTKQVRLDRGNHAALEQLLLVLQAERRDPNLAHNTVITEALGALAEKRPDLAPLISEARTSAEGAVVA